MTVGGGKSLTTATLQIFSADGTKRLLFPLKQSKCLVCGPLCATALAVVANIFTFHHLSISRENSTDAVMKEEMEMMFSLLTYRLRYASIKASKTTMLI